jgi:succinoglycan biosynthesis transport protein ExoP
VAIRIPSRDRPSDLKYSSPMPNTSCRGIDTGPAGGQEWSAIECGRVLYRHKTSLLWIAGLGILVAAILSAIQPRIYRSQASIQIQGINDNFLNFRDIYPTTAPSADNAVYVQTQAEMLRQDALIEQVVRKLHLEEQLEFRYVSRPWNGFSAKAASLRPATWAAVENVKENLQIVPSRGSSIIRIEYEARDPQLASDIANTLAQTFIEQSIEARQHAAGQTLASLSLELEALRKTILKSETALAYGRGPGKGGLRPSVIGPGPLPWEMPNAFKRELDGNRQFYEVISRRVDEARVASNVRQSNVRLVGPAQPAAHPHKPNVPLNLAIGMFGGMALAIGYVMLREQTSSVLHSPGEAGAYLALPELGAIPKATNRKFAVLGFLGAGIKTLPVERASLEQPSSSLSEAFRGTLTAILSAGHNVDHPRILVVTSSRPMEGKTTVVSNLGIALAEIGSKVLLIDGDLRRPRLHKVFDQINSWGLSDMLREKNAIEELPLDALVKRTTIPHLHLLPSGTCVDNIFGLLCSGRMARLLPRFRQEFDYVLVDAPPCLEFADARIMAWYAETLLLVVRADYTDRKTAQAAVRRLSLDGTPVMGVILNYWDPSKEDLYGYGRYHQDLA